MNPETESRRVVRSATARWSRTGVLALAITLGAPLEPLVPLASSLAAQEPAREPAKDEPTIVPRDTAHAERRKTLFTYRDGLLAAGFAGLTFAMFPADERIAKSMQREYLQTISQLDDAATSVEWITTPGAFFIGGGLYAAGRLTKRPNLSDLGWHGTEAVLISSGITGMLKGLLGRSRPFVSADTNARDFKFGKGFGTSERQSFPSGHTTTAFAAASAVTSEVQRLWPKYTWYVAPVLYGGATLVGISRMYHNRQWASDVAVGAAIGTFSGLKVVRYSHAHPDNPVDRVLLRAVIAPDGRGGGYLGFTLPAP
jgi:membrane-associated phospholipid phosphatase/HAMP domain-containing protein